jgi:sulfur carrier protein
MELIINGDIKDVGIAITVQDLLKELGYQGSFVAVAINRTCVKHSEFATTSVAAGDEIEILAPMAGG